MKDEKGRYKTIPQSELFKDWGCFCKKGISEFSLTILSSDLRISSRCI